MERLEFRNALINILQSSYTIQEPYTVANRDFDFYGHFNQRNAKYLASKKLEYYAFSTYDHLFFKSISSVSESFLKDIKDLTEEIIDVYAKVDDEHMETSLTFVIHSEEELTPEIQKIIKKNLNFIKNFTFGLQGWAKLKLVIMVPTSNEVYVNKYGNRDKASFQKILNKILNP
jgi:Mg2+ and Co2+ transporter CorA